MRSVFIIAACLAFARPVAAADLVGVDPSIIQDLKYATVGNFTGARVPGYENASCRLIPAAAQALAKVQADLRAQNLSLKVYDCYRPPQATRFFVNWARSRGPAFGRFHPRIEKGRLFAAQYISTSSRHSLGIAVDLTLVRLPRAPTKSFDPAASYGDCAGPANARAPDDSIDMGTGFDCFDARSATRSSAIAPEQRQWRETLVKAMARHGFRNYHREWWHFEFRGR